MIVLRYVLARPAVPREPKRLAKGKVSIDKKQDTTADLYAAACEVADQDICQDTYEHFKQRDRRAWWWVMDFPVTDGEAQSVASEMGGVTREMRGISSVPGRNPWACTRPRCDWLDLCHANPDGNVDEWWGVETNDYSGLREYAFTYKNGQKKALKRDKPGAVLSPSELRTFLTCRRKWWFEYVKMAQRVKSKTNYGPRMRGVMAHKAAEIMGEMAKPMDLDDNLITSIADGDEACTRFADWCCEYMEQFNLDGAEDTTKFLADAERSFFAGKLMFKNATRDMDRILSIEQRYAFLLPGTKSWITCQPDIVCQKDEDIYIIDYKTSSSSRLDQVAEDYRYNPALYLYALALTNGYEATEVMDV